MIQLGVLVFCTEDSVPIGQLARLAEERGVESLWVPEHTHIPSARATPTPLSGGLPKGYSRLFDPLLALTAAAATTSRLRLGTGVALVAHHHPITLAKQIATLDRLSGGRVLLGVGAGWNAEEIENHGVDPSTRWRRTLEHVAAMKAIWAQDEASFCGEWVSFEQIWSWPKPVQRPHPPILLGTLKPSDLVIRHADGWLPLSVAHPHDLAKKIGALRSRAETAGRDPDSLDVTVFCLESTTPERVHEYAGMGANRVVLRAPTGAEEHLSAFLDTYAAWLDAPITATQL
jgi:probable F420-dependent oxidoreductase